jgi:hypothetical protein
MLEYLEDIDKFDVLFFLPHSGNEDIHVQSNVYKDPGKPIGGSSVGPEWHVILFKDGKEEEIDSFDAILLDPREYISGLIPQDWYGIVARKTTTSKIFIEGVVAKIKSLC